ncbi:polyubiquitin 14 [Anaeramoeba ignava]|uniref:Polyubiquitin 14 n=1 Tax=Anaeramoeba ignava TaxID=1746090 RepID=A0A9Q0LI58_ANAIG|nr:polyubiquitin 14 [Anaeramoeba ignava]
MKIFIHLLNTTIIIKLEVNPSDKIEKIKEEIEDELEILPNKQRLFFQNKYLDYGRILSDYNIQKNSTLQLKQILGGSPPNFHVYVNISSEKMIHFEIERYTFIKDIKQKIQDETKIPFEKQRLFLESKELLNEITFFDYSFYHNCDLDSLILMDLETGEDEKNQANQNQNQNQNQNYQNQNQNQNQNYQNYQTNQNYQNYQTNQNYQANQNQNYQIYQKQTIQGKRYNNPLDIFYEVQKKYTVEKEPNHQPYERKSKLFEKKIEKNEPIHVFIKMKKQNGEEITFEIDIGSMEKISDLMEKIAEKKNISIDKQKLFFEELSLRKEKGLNEYGIRDYSEVNLVPEYRGIFLKDEREQKWFIECELTDKISIIKWKMQEENGFPFPKIRLFFEKELLENDKTLYDYGIKINSIITITLGYMRTTQIYIKMQPQKSLRVFLYRWDPIIEIMKIIEERKGIPIQKQVLLYSGNILDPSKNLKNYGIKPSQSIILDLEVLRISQNIKSITDRDIPITVRIAFIKPSDKLTSVYVKSNGIIQDLMNIIEKFEGISIENQILFHKTTILEKGVEINEYQILDDAIINLIPQFPGIFVKTSTEKKLFIPCNENDTIEFIKQSIKNKEKKNENEIKLIYHGRQLENEKKLLDYGITSGSVIFWVLPSNELGINLQINLPSRNPLQIPFVQPNKSIVEIMSEIEKRKGVPYYNQILSYSGKRLEPLSNLTNYGIDFQTNQSIILDLEIVETTRNIQPLKQIVISSIENPYKFIEMKIALNETVYDLMERIKKTGNIEKFQTLIFKSKELFSNRKLYDYGIKDGSIIYFINY